MIIFLYGADDWRRTQKLGEIIENYEQKQSIFSVDFFDFSLNNGEFGRFKDFLAQQVIFASKKLAVVKNISKLTNDKEKELAKILKNHLEDEQSVIIISDSEIPAAGLKFLLDKPVLAQFFEPLEGEKLKFFIKREAAGRGLSLSAAAVNFLSLVFEKNSWGIITELDKLAFCGQKELSAADLERFSHFFISPNIFLFINAAAGNLPLPKKITALEKIFPGEDPAAVFNILATRSFLNFNLIERLAALDVAIKSGKLDYDLALLKIALSS